MIFKKDCLNCFAGLSCQTRIEIINILKVKGKTSVLEIAKHFKLSQPTISHHLKYLEKAGMIAFKKEGRKVYYFVDSKCKRKCSLFV